MMFRKRNNMAHNHRLYLFGPLPWWANAPRALRLHHNTSRAVKSVHSEKQWLAGSAAATTGVGRGMAAAASPRTSTRGEGCVLRRGRPCWPDQIPHLIIGQSETAATGRKALQSIAVKPPSEWRAADGLAKPLSFGQRRQACSRAWSAIGSHAGTRFRQMVVSRSSANWPRK